MSKYVPFAEHDCTPPEGGRRGDWWKLPRCALQDHVSLDAGRVETDPAMTIARLIRRAFDAWQWRRARRQVLREYPELRGPKT